MNPFRIVLSRPAGVVLLTVYTGAVLLSGAGAILFHLFEVRSLAAVCEVTWIVLIIAGFLVIWPALLAALALMLIPACLYIGEHLEEPYRAIVSILSGATGLIWMARQLLQLRWR